MENLYADPYFDSTAADTSLQRIIAELNDNQREVFCMKYYDELKFSEIAQITNRNENSVKTLFYKAKEILSNQIVLSWVEKQIPIKNWALKSLKTIFQPPKCKS